MNTYVMGEIATLLAVTVLAGILVGWCIKSLMTGRTERKVRAHVARDVDDAAADVANIRQTLLRREAQLKDANQELQKMRGRDVSLKAGNDTQIDEINKLKNELALARQSLDRNRSEFNAFRNDKQTEIQGLGNKLASFQSGGPVHDERMTEASETIGALRTAVRENDKVIDSLRARIKEGDSSVENLRTQLKSSETHLNDAQNIKQTTEASIAKLNTQLQDTSGQRDKFKRDYDSMLENKNKEITRQQKKLEELGKIQTSVAQKEHEYNKLTQDSQANATRSNAQISDLKRAITEKEAQRAESLKNLKRMQDQITALEAKNKTLVANAEKQNTLHTTQIQKTSKELESAKSLGTQVENKTAEVVALNDMLKDVSSKRAEAQSQVTTLEKKLKTTSANAAADAQSKVADITRMLEDRDVTIGKLRSDMDDLVVNRNELSIQLGDLQSSSEQTKTRLLQESEQQVSQMKTALTDRDKSFDKLRHDMDQMAGTRDRLTQELEKLQQHGTQLESFKTSMQTTVAQRDSELQQRKAAYEKLQNEFQQLASTRDDYEKRITALTSEVKSQATQLQDQEKRSTQEISRLQPQISEMRSKLSLADSDNQKLSSELSNAASLKLAITERDAAIQKLRVDLQDAQMTGASSPAQDEIARKVDSLTVALKDRDAEISRLNNAATDNRLGSKKYQSEVTLLKQELDSQSTLIKGLEEQAENTLTLHKKIAAQSTEIEDLRASLYQNDGNKTATASATQAQTDNQSVLSLKTQLQQQANDTASIRNQLAVAQQSLAQAESKLKQSGTNTVQQAQSNELQAQVKKLQSEIDLRNSDIKRLQQQNSSLADNQKNNDQLRQQLDQRNRELGNVQLQLDAAKNVQPSNVSNGAAAPRTASAKPRVFVRQDEANANATESLTGVASLDTTGRAAYTRDGYKLQRVDGKDNLTLLPGINRKAERELNNNGVTDFEQIALWGRREISHFSERVGVSSSQADGFDWPKLAREILAGSYRRSEYKEKDNS